MTQNIAGLDFQNPEDVAPAKTTAVIYGPAGSGKSTFASTWPGAYFMVPSISANELKSLAGLGMKGNVLVFESVDEMHQKAVALANAVRAGNLPDCHTLVFDNLTSAQLVAEHELLDKTGKDKLTWEEWNKFTKLWKDMVLYLHQLPINVLWITHAEVIEIKPEDGVGMSYNVGSPTLTGKSKKFIPGYADMFLYCDSISRGDAIPLEFRVHLKQKDVWPARVRTGVEFVDRLPSYIGGLTPDNRRISPTYDVLAELMGWKSKTQIEGSKNSQVSQESKPKRKYRLPKRRSA